MSGTGLPSRRNGTVSTPERDRQRAGTGRIWRPQYSGGLCGQRSFVARRSGPRGGQPGQIPPGALNAARPVNSPYFHQESRIDTGVVRLWRVAR